MLNSIQSPLSGIRSPFGPRLGFTPLRIFANDEPGVWFEANDATTLFTDVAGTTPVTAPGDAVALQLDKSGRGNHRTQATTAARPLYALHPVGGVRNLLEYTEEFDNAVWVKSESGVATAPVVTEDFADGPLPNTRASRIVFNLNGGTASSDISQIRNSTPYVADEYTVSFWLRSNTEVDQDVIFTIGNQQINTVTVTPTWQRLSLTVTASVDNAVSAGIRTRSIVGSSDVTDILVWGAQLEQGSTATNYQRVGSFLDVSEEGKARRGRIWYNGTSHFMQTGTITPGTDKVQVFAGVRKLSDAAGMVAELSANWATNAGSLSLQAGTQTGSAGSLYYYSSARGNAAATTTQGGEWQTADVSPDTAVLTGTHDIAGDLSTIRRNGVAGLAGTADKGSGNFLAHPLYFGARGGTSLFYNGYEDTSIIRFGPNLDDTTISKVESYVASKTPAAQLLIPAGPELVTNGTFDTDLAGWDIFSGTGEVIDGQASVTADTFGVLRTAAAFTLEPGSRYLLSIDAVSIPASVRYRVGTNPDVNSGLIFDSVTSREGTIEFILEPTASSYYFRAGGNASSSNTYIYDNISIRKFIPK